MAENKNYFQELFAINVNNMVEKKNGLTYLAWANAWGELKKLHPDATYTVYESPEGWNYFTDGRTCWVKTGVTVNGIEHIEYLPVMDFRNKSIPLDSITSFEVNKAIQRSLTKAVARHGLGLYIYAGEDLPEEEKAEQKPAPRKRLSNTPIACEACFNWIAPTTGRNGEEIGVEELVEISMKRFGRKLCANCMREADANR